MDTKAVAHRLVLLVVHLQEQHIRVPLRKLANLHEIDSSGNPVFKSSRIYEEYHASCIRYTFSPHLRVKSTAAAAARGEEVDDDKPLAGVG
jgi:hypothetical protein